MFPSPASWRYARSLLALLLTIPGAVPFATTAAAVTNTATTGAVAAATSHADTVRFLEQSTFGPTPELISHVRSIGFEAFLDEQFGAPVSGYPDLPLMKKTPHSSCKYNAACMRDNYTMYPLQRRFFQNALYGQDQVRQRIAFALTQILVVSGRDLKQPSWVVSYLKTIDRHALGNYRQLLYEITLNPAMGDYLDMAGNNKKNPNENFARELLQLFTIGLDQLNLNGTPKLDTGGSRISNYNQETVRAFARVFTGWNLATQVAPSTPNYRDPMRFTAFHHDTGAKTLLNGLVLPAGQTGEQDLNAALDNIYNHPNVAPFISKQLIQHLVTSNPTPAYVERVATVFNDNRTSPTQLQAVVKAILLDPEARGDVKTDPNYGHLREPAQFITNLLRAFGVKSADGTSTSDGHLNPQSEAMGQDIFRAPSVFNYYRPDYEAPTTGILGPKFGILSTATVIKRLNFVNTIVFSLINQSADAPAGTSINLSGMQALATDPAALVEELNRLLLHGTMPQEMRADITQAVANIPGSDSRLRAQTAVYLVATSFQYQVQR